MFSGAEQLVDSFFAELAAQLRLKGGRFERIAERLDSYGELLTPLGLVPFLGALTVDVSPPDARPSSPSSTTSRRSTTRAGATRLSARSPRPRSKHGTLSLLLPEPQAAATRCPRQRRSTPRRPWRPDGSVLVGKPSHRPFDPAAQPTGCAPIRGHTGPNSGLRATGAGPRVSDYWRPPMPAICVRYRVVG